MNAFNRTRKALFGFVVAVNCLSCTECHDGHSHDEVFCGTEVPPLQEELINKIRLDAFHRRRSERGLQIESCHELCDQCIEIETYLHLIGTDLGFGPIIPHPQSTLDKAREDITSVALEDFSTIEDIVTMFEKNVEVVNDAFAGTPFRFKFVREGTTVTTDARWSESMINYKEEIGQALGNGDLRKLDCFISESLRPATNGAVLGTATLPGSQSAGKGDGVYIRYDTLPGGGRPNNSLGYTLVHEIGHWLGLLHTFQQLVTTDPCDPEEENFNDFVDDTPLQNGPSSRMIEDCTTYLGGKTALPDSCPNLPGRDALFNFLNYPGHEECLVDEGSFTCGQIERMYRHYMLFREKTMTCEDPLDMEIEIVFILDSYYVSQNQIQLVAEDGHRKKVIFDSVRDHWVAYLVAREQRMFLIDACVPRRLNYKVRVLDSANNGFGDGLITVFADKTIKQHIRGNFGDSTWVHIPSQPRRTPAPTESSAPSPGSASPSFGPSFKPSLLPSQEPSLKPSVSPRPSQSVAPTFLVSHGPSHAPSLSPAFEKSEYPSTIPSEFPSDFPSLVPSIRQSEVPSIRQSELPSSSPSAAPTAGPTSAPTTLPSVVPTDAPTAVPWYLPTKIPSLSPTNIVSSLTPSITPTRLQPSLTIVQTLQATTPRPSPTSPSPGPTTSLILLQEEEEDYPTVDSSHVPTFLAASLSDSRGVPTTIKPTETNASPPSSAPRKGWIAVAAAVSFSIVLMG